MHGEMHGCMHACMVGRIDELKASRMGELDE